MVDFWYLVAVIVAGAGGGGLVDLFIHAPLAWKIKRLENSFASGMGVSAKKEMNEINQAEFMEAVAEAVQMHQDGRSIPEIIKEVGLKHPSVAMKLIKDVMSGKLKLPSGLGGGKLF